MKDTRPLNGLTLEAYANQLPTWQARRLARVAGYDALVNGKAATMHRFYEYVLDTAADPAARERLLKASGLHETAAEAEVVELPLRPTRIVRSGGGFATEEIDAPQRRRGIDAHFGEQASEAEREKLERRARERDAEQEQRNAEREAEAERRPDPEPPAGWFGR